MKTLINTDNHIHNSTDLQERVETMVENSIGRFSSRITRVEVHLEDVNSEKGGSKDKRCVIEARLEGLKPVATHYESDTMGKAVDGAVGKLERAIEHTLGKLAHR